MITSATSLNSFWSISFCVLALVLHSYATYLAVQRQHEATARAWPAKAQGPPAEVGAHLALVIVSCLLLPVFAVCSVLRVGNYGNDGVKLGRDHALNPNLDACCRKVRSPLLRRLWRGCVPLAQTAYLAAAFLLLLPDTLLTAVEVDYGYKTTGE
jgi:ABC-type Fe3+ transport system permease subunit